ncbi:MAG TPA: hypothetical protein VHH36_08830, partial [Candidatus Thermoplasmatota archaeon]|nr:hypothetical protein [Candidatus Thermoplasmatota archaeon]
LRWDEVPADARALVLRLLAERAEGRAPREVGVLFARHGHLWRADADLVTRHEAFPAVEAWFAERMASPPGAAAAPRWTRKRATGPAPPVTDPRGRARKKKTRRAEPPAPPPPKRKAERRGEPDAPPAPSKPARPDWRKGSAWRRQRGL